MAGPGLDEIAVKKMALADTRVELARAPMGLGKLPDAVELVTPVSAAVAFHSKNPEAARLLLWFLTREAMRSVLERHGLEPAAPHDAGGKS